MEKISERFVPVNQVKEWMAKVDFYTRKPHCKICGDTTPKHNFYPLFSSIIIEGHFETSSLMCNRCAMSDEDYLRTFKEPKEIIS